MGGVRAPSGVQADREACKLSLSVQAHREACELYAMQAHWEASPLTSMAAHLAHILSINGAQAAVNSLFKYKTLIANVLVRTPVCKPTASPGSQEKMCRAGFLQILIANDLDRTPVCKVRAAQDLCIPSTQTVVSDDPCGTTYKQFGKICQPL